jgi:hypothetical protein
MGRPKKESNEPEPVQPPTLDEFERLKNQEQLNAIYALLLVLKDK